MTVVPGLSWPILFGQNHLKATHVFTGHAELSVHFKDPGLNFTIKCYDSNPLQAVPSLSQTKHVSASGSGSTSVQPQQHGSNANVTCLLTAMPHPPHNLGSMLFYTKD